MHLGPSATVRLIEGVRLIRCPLNTGFTVALSRFELLGMYSAEVRWSILHVLRIHLYLAHALNTPEGDLRQEKLSPIYYWAVPQAAQ